MAAVKMHTHQIETTTDLVRRLLATQCPHLSDRRIQPVAESGTDHALYRLGEDLVARLPIIYWAAEQAESDQRWLPVLAPQLTLPTPVPVAVGRPGEGYPWSWSVVPWFAGEVANEDNVDLATAAVDLAQFVRALHCIPTAEGPLKSGHARGAPLRNLDASIQLLIVELQGEIDATAVAKAWGEAVAAPSWDAPPVWIHGDIQPGNMIIQERRLAAIIDFGALGIGDPAPDLAPAWNLLDQRARTVFRDSLGCDEATWVRGKGWVLAPALQGLRYYRSSRPDFVAAAHHRISAVLADLP
ncbi:MAG: aminoglycoside phosphotransferase family protein [Nocardioidaceae bacterium]